MPRITPTTDWTSREDHGHHQARAASKQLKPYRRRRQRRSHQVEGQRPMQRPQLAAAAWLARLTGLTELGRRPEPGPVPPPWPGWARHSRGGVIAYTPRRTPATRRGTDSQQPVATASLRPSAVAPNSRPPGSRRQHHRRHHHDPGHAKDSIGPSPCHSGHGARMWTMAAQATPATARTTNAAPPGLGQFLAGVASLSQRPHAGQNPPGSSA